MKQRNLKKKLSAAVMAVLLLVSLLALPAAAEDYDAADATRFVFSDEAIEVSEGSSTGYKIEGTALTINGSGTYVVSGECADGSITVKKGTTGVVLVLDGLTLASADTAPIACNKSTEVTIVAAAGSVNTLSDSEYNNDENYSENENAENAVIKTKDGSRVTLCGSGTINVIASGKNGVKGGATTEEEGEASLTVRDLTLNITAAVNDGLKSDQELNILGGTVTVSAADDGIKSDLVLNIGAEGTDGPTILVSESNEGIEGATINIYSGNITVHATDDAINAANSDLTDYSYACNIYGGTLYVDAAEGDGIDSNGTLTISGGTVQVFSSESNDNSPLDSDGTFTLSGGTVLAVGSAGMAQTPQNAEQAYVSFGAAGMGGMGGMQRPEGVDGMQRPEGVDGMQRPEGMDGMQRPEGMDGMQRPEGMDGMQRPEGMDGTQRPDGMGGMGRLGGMDQTGAMGGASAVSVSAGDTVEIVSSSGETLCSAAAVRSASYVFFSSDALVEGETYTLNVNGSAAAEAQASTAAGMGGMLGWGDMPEPPTGDMPEPPAGDMPEPRFTDVTEDDWFHDYVIALAKAGIVDGYPDGSFRPGETLTWAQAMKLLLCAHEDLADVTGDGWAETAMGKAAELGLCDAAQEAAAEISRLDFCKAATALFEVSGTAEAFPDCDDADVLALHGAGVIDGFGDGTFRPESTLTRAQIAKIICLLAK